jgi:hypothetical protein
MSVPVRVRYWTDHCVHSQPFDGLRAAVDFLELGWRRHEFAPDAIITGNGRVLVSREEVVALLAMNAAARESALRSILDRSASRSAREPA